ncbi:MAG: SprT-like domain-containing protein [Prevotella sp.]|nr:SprT-like domain-containing protein [Prevotella sp.]
MNGNASMVMELNVKVLTNMFRHCNEKYFGGALPLPILKLSHSKTRLGYMSFTRRVTLKGVRLEKFVISISDYYNMTAEQVEDVMTHEMIHYSIAFSGAKDTSAHGVMFRRKMNAINQRYGRHIKVMTPTSDWTPRRAPAHADCVVLAVRMHDGKCFLSVVSPGSIGRLELQIRRIQQIAWHGWYVSADPYFSNMPKVRSLRGRIVSKEEFEQWLKKMTPVR